MTIFISSEIEETIQVDDKTRIDASKVFVTPDEDALTSIQIMPDKGSSTPGSAYFEVISSDKYLDWQYDASGTKTVCVRAKAGASGDYEELEKTITVVTATVDKLFSTDAKLKVHEPDILKWVQPGRNSFKDVHRRAQKLILDYLDQKGFTDVYGERLTKDAIVVTDEMETWATFMALRLIFEGISNETDDIFADKAEKYGKLEMAARDRAVLRLDIDGDGTASEGEETWFSGGTVVRR